MKAHHFDKETGKWGVCNAQPGNCPKSPANRHFNSYGQMNQYSVIIRSCRWFNR